MKNTATCYTIMFRENGIGLLGSDRIENKTTNEKETIIRDLRRVQSDITELN